MSKKALQTGPIEIETLIVEVRGQRAILDSDLAALYAVPTKALNQAVKRNADKFPADFMFQLSSEEVVELARSRSRSVTLNKPGNRSQTVTGSQKHRDPRHLPYAFTEHGAIMAANVLNSPRASQMSLFVVRAFVKMRSLLTDTRELARKLAALEQDLKGRLDIHEAAIVEVLQGVMKILDPPPPPPEPPPPEIGFHVKEDAIPYRVRRKGRGSRQKAKGIMPSP